MPRVWKSILSQVIPYSQAMEEKFKLYINDCKHTNYCKTEEKYIAMKRFYN